MAMVMATGVVFAAEKWEDTSNNTTWTFNESKMYIIEFEVKQSHFTLDVSEHFKDSMNKFTFEVPVDKEYYNSLRVGQEISNNFRMGSFIMKGSIGKWKITVKNKRIINRS